MQGSHRGRVRIKGQVGWNSGRVSLSANEVVLFAAACAASLTPYELHTEHRALLSARQLFSPPLRPFRCAVFSAAAAAARSSAARRSASLALSSANAFSRSMRAVSRSAARALRASMTRTRASSRARLSGSFGPGAERNFLSSAALALPMRPAAHGSRNRSSLVFCSIECAPPLNSPGTVRDPFKDPDTEDRPVGRAPAPGAVAGSMRWDSASRGLFGNLPSLCPGTPVN